MGSAAGQDVFDVGDIVNNTYRIESVLGQGGMGAVYLASHELTHERVAIKVLKSEFTDNAMHLELMKREQAVKRVFHDAVIRYFELGRTADGDLYLVMDYVEGEPLDKRFASAKHAARPLTPLEAAELGHRVSEGLAACHIRGVIHRDLSPDNILLREGSVSKPVIIDFGIAKNTSASVEQGTVIGPRFAGKFTYAPPEQFQGEVDARSDLYALGVTLVAALRGKAPSFGQNDFQIVQNKQLPLDLSDMPPALAPVLIALTDPDPERRPQDADEAARLFAEAARQIASGEDGGAEEATVIGRPMPRPGGEGTVVGGAQTWPPQGMTQPGRSMPPADPLDLAGYAPPRGTETPRTAPPGTQGPRTSLPEFEEPEPRRRGGGLLWVLLLLVALGGGGYGAWYMGLPQQHFPQYFGHPPVSPFTFSVVRDARGRATLTGHLPDEAAASTLTDYLSGLPEVDAVDPQARIASGAPTASFAEDMRTLLRTLAPLEDFSLAVTDSRAEVEGLAPNREAAEQVRTAVAETAGRLGYEAEADIAIGPRWLAPEDLTEGLATTGGCGQLRVSPPTGARFALGESVRVSGSVPDSIRAERLRQRLEERVGDRPLQLDLEVLNEPVCLILALLPAEASSEALDIWFGFGNEPSERENATGAYAVGENPLIDIRMPEDASWGHLHVVAVDVKGTAFHLLPNAYIEETEIAELGKVEGGQRIVRVAHDERRRLQDGSVIAFRIDETFGKTLVIAFHTEQPLFDGLRPIQESAESLAEALEERVRVNPLDAADIATRMIDTRAD